MSYKILALAILFAVCLWNLFLNLLKWRSVKNPIPKNVSDVYDRETYEKWKAYNGEKTRLSIYENTASFFISVLLLGFNVYALFARLFADNAYAQMFGVLLLSALSDLLLLPFHYYDIMKVEEKYGFNRTTKKTFCVDQVKEFVIGLGLISFVGWLLTTVHQALGDWLILAFAGGMTAIMLLFSFLYPFFSRIFNKFTPLEEGELKTKVTALLEKNGYKVRAIQVMDASRRSTKSNAYFTGFGKMKTIVLYDTLVETMTPDEICAVFAHEMGHGLHKDTLKNQILTFVQMLILGVLAWLTLRSPEIFRCFGFDKVNYGFAIILIMSVEFSLVAPLYGLLVNWRSRRAEYRADAQAVKEGYGDSLTSALKKLARENFADLSPHPLLVKLEYSHPTLSQRIEAIQKAGKGNSIKGDCP